MAYGSVKVDTIVYDNSGSDVSIAVSGIPTASAINAKADLASPAFTSDIELSAQAPLKFMDADSSNYVAFKAPATVGSNVTWTLPATDAAGTLTSDGSGTLSWAAASGGGGGASLGLALALG